MCLRYLRAAHILDFAAAMMVQLRVQGSIADLAVAVSHSVRAWQQQESHVLGVIRMPGDYSADCHTAAHSQGKGIVGKDIVEHHNLKGIPVGREVTAEN